MSPAFNLIDDEYGCSNLVYIDDQFAANELVRCRRQHPDQICKGRPLAIAISSGENEMFRGLEVQQEADSGRH